MNGINLKLYPQYNIVNDRRKSSVPVELDRRSGGERRSADRLQLDTGLKKDIFEIKSKIQNIQKTDPQNVEQSKAKDVSFTRAAADKMTIHTGDEFIKTIVKNEPKVEIPKADSTPPSAMGAMAFMLGGIIAATTMGAAAVGAVVGLGAYFGAKIIKEVVSSRLKK